jgi:hypothetical protein
MILMPGTDAAVSAATGKGVKITRNASNHLVFIIAISSLKAQTLTAFTIKIFI